MKNFKILNFVTKNSHFEIGIKILTLLIYKRTNQTLTKLEKEEN